MMERKMISITIKKDLVALIKNFLKTASHCQNKEQGKEDMQMKSSDYPSLKVGSDPPYHALPTFEKNIPEQKWISIQTHKKERFAL